MKANSQPFRADAPAVSELAAGTVVVDPVSHEVLLLHHTAEDRWCLPKGHVEPGEAVADAAAREAFEETGLADLRLADEVGSVTYRFFDPERQVSVVKTSIYFLAVTTERTARPEPLFDQYRWMTTRAALARVAYDTDRDILRGAARALRRSPLRPAPRARASRRARRRPRRR